MAATSPALAHPANYVAGSGRGVLVCVPNAGTCVNGAYFQAGHVPLPFILIVNDFALSPVGAFVCQDTNENLVCGDGLGDPSEHVCGSGVVGAGVMHGAAWSSQHDLYVFIDNAATGALRFCGPGTAGFVDHA